MKKFVWYQSRVVRPRNHMICEHTIARSAGLCVYWAKCTCIIEKLNMLNRSLLTSREVLKLAILPYGWSRLLIYNVPYTLHNKAYKGRSEFLFVLNVNGLYSFDFCIEVLDESSCISNTYWVRLKNYVCLLWRHIGGFYAISIEKRILQLMCINYRWKSLSFYKVNCIFFVDNYRQHNKTEM